MSPATQRLIRHTVYLLLAFLFCSKAWLNSGLIIGGGDQPDWTGTAWAYWWTGYALTHGFNPFDGQWNFFPVGQRPLAQYNLLDALIAWPLLKIFGVRIGESAIFFPKKGTMFFFAFFPTFHEDVF